MVGNMIRVLRARMTLLAAPPGGPARAGGACSPGRTGRPDLHPRFHLCLFRPAPRGRTIFAVSHRASLPGFGRQIGTR